MEKLFGLEMTTLAGCLGTSLFIVILVLGIVGLRSRVMFKLGIRPIFRRPTQSGLIVIGLMLATLIITAAFVMGDTLSYTIRSIVIEELGPVDEVITLRSNGVSGSNSTYFSMARFEEFATELSDYPLVDAVVPAIQETVPAVNLTQNESMRALQVTGFLPEDPKLVVPSGELIDPEDNPLEMDELGSRGIYLNYAAAEALNAQPGDRLELFVGTSPKQFVVGGMAAEGRSPRGIMNLHEAQALFGQRSQINRIMISNLGDQDAGARQSEAVTEHLRGMLMNETAVNRLFRKLASDSSAAEALRLNALTYEGNTREDLLTLAAGLEGQTLDEGIRSLLADEGLSAEVLSILEKADWRTDAARSSLERQFQSLSDYSVQDWKRDGLDTAELAANAFTSIFVVTGLFGIASGLLLIFLIFVMLAAERKSEMGMTRAIGAQRRHLVQMFVFEGTAYDIAAAGVGVGLGVLVGMTIALIMGNAFASTELDIYPHVTFKGLAVSYSLGMLVTFMTVLFSANRVSRLNIVAAIRDLPEPPTIQAPMRERILAPLRTLIDGFRYIRHLKVWKAFKTWVIQVPLSILRLIWAGFRSGILTFLLGLLLIPVGLNSELNAVFTIGVSLAIIGGGLTLRMILSALLPRHKEQSDRIAFTIIGLALTIFWSLPSDVYEQIGVTDLKGGPEMLFIAGFMMVVGAVMVVMYNTDLLIAVIMRILGGGRRLAPILRMAVAYPLANRFRTGLTLGMFGVVVFSVVFMATAFKANQVFFENTERLTGGFQLRAQISANNPIDNLARKIQAKPQLRTAGFEAITSESTASAEVKQEGGQWEWYRLRGMDAAYFENIGYDIAIKAEGYETTQEVWEAVRDHPGLAVIDSYPVPSRQTTNIVIGGPEFQLTGVYLEDETMTPIRLRVREPGGEPFEVTIIGVLETSAYMSFGLMTSQLTLDKELAAPPPATQYYFRLAEGVSPAEVGSLLEKGFVDFGLESVDQVQEIEDAQAAQRAIEMLLLGFLTLGLIVGVAALGVISSRAVVERRQQIGVLRALGFQGQMVTWSFMLEASFVALLGITLGAVLALIPAYQMITDLSSDIPGLTFHVPWSSIAIVVGLAYGMTLLATYLPAKQASRVAPAEALRYE